MERGFEKYEGVFLDKIDSSQTQKIDSSHKKLRLGETQVIGSSKNNLSF